MNKDVFRKLRQMLMEELDLSRELSDKEILDVIDELILNQIKDVRLALKEKVQLSKYSFVRNCFILSANWMCFRNWWMMRQ